MSSMMSCGTYWHEIDGLRSSTMSFCLVKYLPYSVLPRYIDHFASRELILFDSQFCFCRVENYADMRGHSTSAASSASLFGVFACSPLPEVMFLTQYGSCFGIYLVLVVWDLSSSRLL